MANWEKLKRWLAESIDGNVLGLYRILFGLLMAYNAWSYYDMGLVENGLLAPKVLFKYDGFGWLHPFSRPVMTLILFATIGAALLIAAGLLFRWACLIFSLTLAFFLFQEKSYYNNHIYLFILLGVLLSFTNADRFLSLRPRLYAAVPRWQQFILGAQVMIVYFYGGLTKLKFDWWYHREPLAGMCAQFPVDHWMAPFLRTDFAVSFLTYGGLLLDLLSPWLLWYKPVRKWALIPFVLFHLSNAQIFNDIAIFPFVMLASLILYFETPEIPGFRKWVAAPAAPKKRKKKEPVANPGVAVPPTTALTRKILTAYFVFQILFPFRGFLLPNPIDWTGVAKHFSWRMKVDNKTLEEMNFYVENPATGQVIPVDIRSFVNEMQVLNMMVDARSVAAFAREVREEMKRQGMPNAIVRARIRVRYNWRPPQFFVNPEVDLASVSYSPFKKMDWVLPLAD